MAIRFIARAMLADIPSATLRAMAPRIAAGILVLATTAQLSASWAQETSALADAIRPSDYREPVKLSSKDGVLEVTLRAHQGTADLDTVARPVENMLLFGYTLIRGTASDGSTSGAGLYPSPTLQVFPGETLIVHLENDLSALTIRDFFDPRYIAKGEDVPLYPAQLGSSPLNLHVHGLHVSPRGNSDNVMLHVPAGMSNTYTYNIPKNVPQGAYWYHSHLHGLTTAHVYYGLAGMLAIGRLDGNLPLVTQHAIPIRNMVLQYNSVFDRAGGEAQLTFPSWGQWVNSFKTPVGDELSKGTYRPLLAPVNFTQSKPGTRFPTVWYSGPLSIGNMRGRFQFIPSNLQRFSSENLTVEPDTKLPDARRDVQFTVNGLFQPLIDSKPGQTEIWVLSNISDIAYMSVQLTETATGRHPKIAIVGQDGNPSPAVHYPVFEAGTRLVIPPASRYAIAVTMPDTGELVLDMPPMGGGARTLASPGVLYESNGTENPPATLGTVSVLPSAISYFDGFFVFPTQVLARAVPSGERGVTVPFLEGQRLEAVSAFEELSQLTPDFKRELVITGGFLNDLASPIDPKAFVYAFDGTAFPNVPLIQPRLNSVEEWTFVNDNNDEHPIHVHVNDFQVTSYFDPTTGLKTGPEMWEIDNANVPAPLLGPGESVIQPGTLSMRTRFEEFTGLYVMHCHRLNHEDNGLMALVNVIPEVSSYAVAAQGAPGRSAKVDVFDGNGDKLIATVEPFPGYEGALSVAMGDIDADGVLDLVVGAGANHMPTVVVYSGKATDTKPAFSLELARFSAFDDSARSGVSVTAAQIDGSTADNVIVGSGPGMPSEVKVFSSDLGPSGTAPPLFTTFAPYAGDTSGVTLASGFVDFATGRYSIITAPGAGTPTQVKVFSFSLMKPLKSSAAQPGSKNQCPGPKEAALTSAFMPFGIGYSGGVSLSTGWLTGGLGGAETIVVGQLAGPGTVKVYSSGSALGGGPATYLRPHAVPPTFKSIAQLRPFEDASGVNVATTSTTIGADLLISGLSRTDRSVTVRKYRLSRPDASAATLDAKEIGEVISTTGSFANALGGD